MSAAPNSALADVIWLSRPEFAESSTTARNFGLAAVQVAELERNNLWSQVCMHDFD